MRTTPRVLMLLAAGAMLLAAGCKAEQLAKRGREALEAGRAAEAADYLERALAEKPKLAEDPEFAARLREARYRAAMQNGRYLAGLASLLELLDAEDLEQEARQRRIEAQRDEAIKSAQLLSACGMLGG